MYFGGGVEEADVLPPVPQQPGGFSVLQGYVHPARLLFEKETE